MNRVNEIDFRDWDLECPICLERFDDPRILSCFHTFCYNCITNLPQKECPTCDKSFTADILAKDGKANTAIQQIEKLYAKLKNDPAPQPVVQVVIPAPQPAPEPVVQVVKQVANPVAVRNYEFMQVNYENKEHITLISDFLHNTHSLELAKVFNDLKYSFCFYYVTITNKMIDFMITGVNVDGQMTRVHISNLTFLRDRQTNEQEIIHKLSSFLNSHSSHSYTNRLTFAVTEENMHYLSIWIQACREASKYLEFLTLRNTSLTLIVDLDRPFEEKEIFSSSLSDIRSTIYLSLVKLHQVFNLLSPFDYFADEPHVLLSNELVTMENEKGEIEGYLLMNTLFMGKKIEVNKIFLLNDTRENRCQLIEKTLLRIHQIPDQTTLNHFTPIFYVDNAESEVIKEFEEAADRLHQKTGIRYTRQFNGLKRDGSIECQMRRQI